MICRHHSLQEPLIKLKIITESLSSFCPHSQVTISLISPHKIPFQPAKHACDSPLLLSILVPRLDIHFQWGETRCFGAQRMARPAKHWRHSSFLTPECTQTLSGTLSCSGIILKNLKELAFSFQNNLDRVLLEARNLTKWFLKVSSN